MWIEGRVPAPDFINEMVKNITSTPSGSTKPLWEMISSNVGNTADDDGYVFYSTGSTGKDKLYVGLKNYIQKPWFWGPRFFIADGYEPALEEGNNGFTEGIVQESLRLNYSDGYNSASVFEDYLIEYKMSVTKDRIIIIVNNRMSLLGTSSYRTDCFIYLGLMIRYSEETDSSACVIASNFGHVYNTYNGLRVLRNKQRALGAPYNTIYLNMLPLQNLTGWNSNPQVATIPLYHATEGYRGELDGILVGRNELNANYSTRKIPYVGNAVVDGKNYECVYKTYHMSSVHNQFDETTEAMIFLIEKK